MSAEIRNILVIDQGNSKCKLAVCHGDTIIYRESVEGLLTIETVEQIATEYGIEEAVYCSVAKVDIRLVESMRCLFHDDGLLVVTHHTPMPIKMAYATPDTLGMDRLVAAVGASEMYPGKTILIIDAGSAITEDIVDADGTFRGGRISPGIMLRYQALHHFTGRLPLVSPEAEADWIGTSTESCISSGVIKGIEGEILQMVAEAPIPIELILLTGGDAPRLLEAVKNTGIPIVYDPDLVTKSLRRIYLYNENI